MPHPAAEWIWAKCPLGGCCSSVLVEGQCGWVDRVSVFQPCPRALVYSSHYLKSRQGKKKGAMEKTLGKESEKREESKREGSR